MATRYPIEKILSVGKRVKMMVSVKFEGRTVTRHLVNGKGRHPNDKLFEIQTKLLKGLNDAEFAFETVSVNVEKAKQIIETSEKPGEVARVKNWLPNLVTAKVQAEAEVETVKTVYLDAIDDDPAWASYYANDPK